MYQDIQERLNRLLKVAVGKCDLWVEDDTQDNYEAYDEAANELKSALDNAWDRGMVLEFSSPEFSEIYTIPCKDDMFYEDATRMRVRKDGWFGVSGFELLAVQLIEVKNTMSSGSQPQGSTHNKQDSVQLL